MGKLGVASLVSLGVGAVLGTLGLFQEKYRDVGTLACLVGLSAYALASWDFRKQLREDYESGRSGYEPDPFPWRLFFIVAIVLGAVFFVFFRGS